MLLGRRLGVWKLRRDPFSSSCQRESVEGAPISSSGVERLSYPCRLLLPPEAFQKVSYPAILDVSRVNYAPVTPLTMMDYLLNGISYVVRGGSVRM